MDLTLLGRAVGAMLAASLTVRALRGRRPPEFSEPFNDLLGAVLVGMAAGRLAYVVGEGIDVIAHPLELVLIRGGIVSVPAAMAAIGFLVWVCRGDLWSRLDHLVPAALVGLAVWEAGCWWQGSCLGSPSGLWWAIGLPGSNLTRHPVGMYVAVLLVAAAIWLWRRPLPWSGGSAAVGLGWASAVRLMVPIWSVGGWSNWTWWYLVGLVLGLGGVVAARHRSKGR